MRECGRITSKTSDLKSGEGGRLSPCPSEVSVNESDPEGVDSGGVLFKRDYLEEF